ncbi:MAG: hypothetical protein Q8K60_03380 [Parachlamydiaceae bacterium]|nr:hypothetical protein [Parachlamydiaceae bacterium]
MLFIYTSMEKYIKPIVNKIFYPTYEEFVDAALSAQNNKQINRELEPVTDHEKIAKQDKEFTEQANKPVDENVEVPKPEIIPPKEIEFDDLTVPKIVEPNPIITAIKTQNQITEARKERSGTP